MGCEGCHNRDFQSFSPAIILEVDELFKRIVKAKNEQGVTGVTLSGGEPLLQSRGVLELVKRVKDELELAIMLYTGFTWDELKDIDSKELWLKSDIVVSGRYVENLRSPYLKWRGSSNQVIVYNTKETTDLFYEQNECEVFIKEDGSVIITGFPQPDLTQTIKDS